MFRGGTVYLRDLLWQRQHLDVHNGGEGDESMLLGIQDIDLRGSHAPF